MLGALLWIGFGEQPSQAERRSGQPRLPAAPSSPAQPETAALKKALQVVLITSASWEAPRGTAQRFARSTPTARFHPVGSPLPVWLGRSGLGWRSDAQAAPPPGPPGPRKREGDGRSPAGVLTLGTLWGYAEQAPAGVRLSYKTAGALDRCVDDVSSPDYNRLTKEPPDRPPPWHSAESLRLPTDHYKHLVVLHYNTEAPRPGAGSCIFLHVAPPPGAPTAGCTALVEADLLTLLRWLDPAQEPVLLQLPAPLLAATAHAWHLPSELLGR
jgi:D-alanyl-D-alanine dipeptidase